MTDVDRPTAPLLEHDADAGGQLIETQAGQEAQQAARLLLIGGGEVVVPGVQDDDVGLVSGDLLRNAPNVPARDPGHARIDDLDRRPGKRARQATLQEGRERPGGAVGVALDGGLTQDEDAEAVRRLAREEGRVLRSLAMKDGDVVATDRRPEERKAIQVGIATDDPRFPSCEAKAALGNGEETERHERGPEHRTDMAAHVSSVARCPRARGVAARWRRRARGARSPPRSGAPRRSGDAPTLRP